MVKRRQIPGIGRVTQVAIRHRVVIIAEFIQVARSAVLILSVIKHYNIPILIVCVAADAVPGVMLRFRRCLMAGFTLIYFGVVEDDLIPCGDVGMAQLTISGEEEFRPDRIIINMAGRTFNNPSMVENVGIPIDV